MIKEELKTMLGGNIIDVPLADEDYDMAIKLAEEIYPYHRRPECHRRLAFAECLSILGLVMSKFPSTHEGSGKIYLDQSNFIRESLRA